MRNRIRPVLALAGLLLLLGPYEARTQATNDDALRSELQGLVDTAALGERVGIEVRDASTGRVVFQHHPDAPLNPASNMKVVTAAAALAVLGPEFTMRTALYGRIDGNGVADLVIRGQGDPTLEESDLVGMAVQLADRGVRSVARIYVDGSYFDDRLLPPAFEQQPNETAYFRAAVGAVSVDRSTFVLRANPGLAPGARAQLRIHGAGYFDIRNEITTAEGGEPTVGASQAAVGADRMSLRLTGSLPAGAPGVAYRRRVENPLAYAGHLLADALANVGIRGTPEVRVGAGPSGLPMLASHESEPLAQILGELGKHSDNFVAEMVLKVLGAERRRPGSTETGIEVLNEVQTRAGVPAGQATFVNGSGLFNGNRIAASHLSRLLVYVYGNPAIRNEFLAHLAIAGVDGTLARRMQDFPVQRVVRAKTGTLNDVIALTGYVLGPTPDRAYAFSYLANGVGGKQGPARTLADQIARALVRKLHGR
jgi:D-alanyl-D-alanine carboxypeptidase/D-alanyl-D-alanine-endopeptidase (penicillin-binding protein 4)